MNKFLKKALIQEFDAIPFHRPVVFDWQSAEAQSFLDHVDLCVEAGIDINEIGKVIGMNDFSRRYKIIRRKA